MAQKRAEVQHREKVRSLTDEQIGVELKELQDRLFTLRSQAVTEKVDDVAQFGVVRRSIARLLTERSARRAKSAPAEPAKSAAGAKPPSGKKAAGRPGAKAGGAKKAGATGGGSTTGGSKSGGTKTKAAAKAG